MYTVITVTTVLLRRHHEHSTALLPSAAVLFSLPFYNQTEAEQPQSDQ